MELKVRTHVEILGGKSKNDINNFTNLPGIAKNGRNNNFLIKIFENFHKFVDK